MTIPACFCIHFSAFASVFCFLPAMAPKPPLNHINPTQTVRRTVYYRSLSARNLFMCHHAFSSVVSFSVRTSRTASFGRSFAALSVPFNLPSPSYSVGTLQLVGFMFEGYSKGFIVSLSLWFCICAIYLSVSCIFICCSIFLFLSVTCF